MEGGNYCYVLRCGDGSLYTGWTNDVIKRLRAHGSGKGAKYTRGRGPLTLVLLEEFSTRELAMRRECQIKAMTRRQKELLVEDWNQKNCSLIDRYIDGTI